MEIIFATNNNHKLLEIQKILSNDFQILSLKEYSISEEIPEDGSTLDENASQKAWYVYNKTNINCIADDTGLEIESLNGEPGVYSARYAGIEKNARLNMEKVLTKLLGVANRKARFRTVISAIINGMEYQFDGVVNGVITTEPKGNGGFGYDPIFIPDGYVETFAELDFDVKNSISHRGKAVNKLVEFLKQTTK
ncbi:MAG: RdgB/HAM1 family non-canonical purine NTP pyrophosphatase [Marinilabiliaceae bacterium]|nr:RdgB/HAM1 family non-canonical purine NTP pyrophosphatase [Marinilabiliaceae bacterium]